MTQKSILIHYMRHSYMTPMDALQICGCYRFSARIAEIRKMYDLRERWIQVRAGKRVKAFKIKGTK